MAAILSPSRFLDFCDARNVADYVLDTGAAADPADLTNPATTAGARVQLAIDYATGVFYSAVRVGKRYTRDQVTALIALADASSSNPQEDTNLIRATIADLAFARLVLRRNLPADEFKALCPGYENALEYLEQVRSGERIFDEVPLVDDAGLPHANTLPPPNVPRPCLITDNTRIFGTVGQIRNGCQTGPWPGNRCC